MTRTVLCPNLGVESLSVQRCIGTCNPSWRASRKRHSNMWPHALALFLESKQLNGDAAPGVFGGQRAHRCYPFMCQVLLGGGLMRKMGIGFKFTKNRERSMHIRIACQRLLGQEGWKCDDNAKHSHFMTSAMIATSACLWLGGHRRGQWQSNLAFW